MRTVPVRLAGAAVLVLLATAASAQQPASQAPAVDAAQGQAPQLAAEEGARQEPAHGSHDDATQRIEEEARESSARARLQTLGEGAEQIYVVDHTDSWSFHVENVTAAAIFKLWKGIGGPALASKELMDFPFTMSVHRMAAERVIDRILDGYNYTLHYEGGRLAQVHVLGSVPTRSYKTPRLVESRARWTDAEMTLLTGGESPPADQP